MIFHPLVRCGRPTTRPPPTRHQRVTFYYFVTTRPTKSTSTGVCRRFNHRLLRNSRRKRRISSSKYGVRVGTQITKSGRRIMSLAGVRARCIKVENTVIRIIGTLKVIMCHKEQVVNVAPHTRLLFPSAL